MAKHRITKGTGITAEPRVKYDGDDIPAAITAWLTGWGNAWRKGGGDYGAVTLDLIETCEEILDHAGDGPHAPDSQADFAERILWHHKIAKAEIAKGNADIAARMAVRVGYLCCQASMKWKWEDDALRGGKVAGGEKNAAHKTNSRHVALREARFARMTVLVPKIGVDKAAAQCEVEGFGKLAAIKKQWNRFQSKSEKGDT